MRRTGNLSREKDKGIGRRLLDLLTIYRQFGFFYASLVSILLETFGSLYFGIRNIATGLRNGYVEMKFL